MEYLYDLKEKMERELKEISQKPEMGAGDLEIVHKLTDTIKNIDKICLLEEEDGYSQADGRGGYSRNGSYDGGNSYANRGRHYVRGHYSRDSGRGGYSREGRGNYSRNGGREEMMEHVRMAMESAPEDYKEDIRRFLREIEE